MPEVVSNTTPILALMGIGALELLQQLYGEVSISQGVWEEIQQGKDKSIYQDVSQLDWVQVQAVSNQEALAYLHAELDKGEAETLVLAREIEARLVLIDEKAARRVADQLGLAYTGSLGILLRAKARKLIPEIKPLIDQMRANGIWISDTLYTHILQQANEV
jgi:hypothetical protein